MSTPIEKQVEALEDQCGVEFDETGHAEDWRNELGRDLNQLLGSAQWRLGTWGDETDVKRARATLRIVSRLAESEEIRMQSSEPPRLRASAVKRDQP